jgi:hypothetical protein
MPQPPPMPRPRPAFSTFAKACAIPRRPSCDEWIGNEGAEQRRSTMLGETNFQQPVLAAYVVINAELNAPARVAARGGVDRSWCSRILA